jgi:hypothetical protein
MEHAANLPDPIFEDPITDPVQFFAAHRKLLEDLFGGPDWFNNAKPWAQDHPAFQRWTLCKRLEATGQLRMNARDIAVQIGTIILDGFDLARATKGDPAKFSIGEFSNYGDKDVVARIRGGLPDPQQFISTLSEITCAAWLTQRGCVVFPSSETGKPDLHVLALPDVKEMALEVKSAPLTTSKNSVHKRLRKANQQLKAAPASSIGVVLLDLAPSITTQMDGDNIPPNVAEVSERVGQMFQAHFSGISAAMISWRDFSLSPTLRLHSRFTMRRRTILVRNLNAARPLPNGSSLEDYGVTLVFIIDSRLPVFMKYRGYFGFPV